jgi:hypothetical protein
MWYLYTMEFYSATRKNEILSLASKRTELENIILIKSARFRRPKVVCSPSYEDYRPKPNTVVLVGMGHTLRGEHVQEE